MRNDRHGPNRLANYIETHETIMSQLKDDGFVCTWDLEWQAISGHVVLCGEIGCLGNIIIGVTKYLEVLEGDVGDALAGDALNARVQTFRYRYNASVRGRGNFLRVDNSHAHPGHATRHHRHYLDPDTDDVDRPGSPVCMGDDWPHLNEFIEEVRAWYYEHLSELDAEACPTLQRRGGPPPP